MTPPPHPHPHPSPPPSCPSSLYSYRFGTCSSPADHWATASTGSWWLLNMEQMNNNDNWQTITQECGLLSNQRLASVREVWPFTGMTSFHVIIIRPCVYSSLIYYWKHSTDPRRGSNQCSPELQLLLQSVGLGLWGTCSRPGHDFGVKMFHRLRFYW